MVNIPDGGALRSSNTYLRSMQALNPQLEETVLTGQSLIFGGDGLRAFFVSADQAEFL